MQISVTFRQIEPSEALKNYVTDRLTKFKRYLDGPVEAHVVLGLEKFRHLADVTIDSNGHIIKGKEENTDMYAAIDLVMDKIDMQLKKFRDKMRSVKGDRSRSAPRRRPRRRKPGLYRPYGANGWRCRPCNWAMRWNSCKAGRTPCWSLPMWPAAT